MTPLVPADVRESGLDVSTLAADAREYLTRTPRQLPSKALYDPLGSALFDAICELPWYPITRAEKRVIDRHAAEVLREAGEPVVVVELGPGNGDKLERLLRGSDEPRAVHLVDVSAAALATAGRRLREHPALEVVAHPAEYLAGLQAALGDRPAAGRALVAFLGSNIGNFDPPGARAFLQAMRRAMRPGDALLIGADLVKPEPVLLAAYDDPLGVTAAFNLNLLVRLNRELDADFDLGAFAHRAVWNRAERRVEMHLVSRRRQTVRLAAIDLRIDLAANETIWTESSYKFVLPAFEADLAETGFEPSARWVDATSRFALVMARV